MEEGEKSENEKQYSGYKKYKCWLNYSQVANRAINRRLGSLLPILVDDLPNLYSYLLITNSEIILIL